MRSEKRVIYLATQNPKKIIELQAVLGSMWDVRSLASLDQEISWQETGTTFETNAQIKAEAVKPYTDACILADDSGLEVDALDGAPGVYSSRYSGLEGNDAANNTKLLTELQGIPEPQRSARFVCCLCFLDETRQVHFFRGTFEGRIGESPKGEFGFGYDPLFFPDNDARSLAEYSPEEKNKKSHRAQALHKFIEFIGDS
ncbi:RdgB/HAM1 family non-canonical purine NTP pyrophosphatase [Pseudobacteriovorax antillogorgiicola]|uniref:dITP/XTP pyrophosphatase n=1 Tax=Pseudobacteriovorax antillogorgiicola TaxID=1513793 RepID=A0A1Y6CAU1_9BACT|nr:RdgB/HAM1 family non-canonical purine NTP pyrophosphatase [Pseudobacteriovorax antillogorgiicola]TCS48689.1 XTP/dITP diphosphohydrolase [Pseudobacteriovorax antillogorgiicola]SMF54794.1 XTP/dITP diphosphohydrolase [Pseudobacteriovorax antillogorgiicola]